MQTATKDPAAGTPVIAIRNLHKSYGTLEVLKGVDLTAHRGHVVSLIGSSGSGKSTLLRCCNLLEDSQDGEITFEGEPVLWKGRGLGRHPADRGQVTRIRTNLSMVFQQFNLWSHLTILQNVMEAPVTVLGRDKAEVEAAARGYLEKVGIAEKCDAYPAMLSGGQQQRAAIARAMANDPPQVVADEPTGNLDSQTADAVLGLLASLAARGKSVLMVTHERDVSAIADRVVTLSDGRVVGNEPMRRPVVAALQEPRHA